jgi:hypothetical protein
VFSSVTDGFFPRFTAGLSAIVDRSVIFESYKVLQVENGMKRMIAGFQPTAAVVRDSDYNKTDAARKWKRQEPLAYQAIIQMAISTPQAPLEVNEMVLFISEPSDNPFSKTFEPGRVSLIQSETSYYVNSLAEEESYIVGRSNIRKMSEADAELFRVFHVGDVILYEKEDDLWVNGAIEAVTGEDVYSLYLLDYHKTHFHNVPSDKLLLQEESDEYLQAVPPLDLSSLVQAFEYALSQLIVDMWIVDRTSFNVGKGAVEIAFWPLGQAIMKFDGSVGVEFNLFMVEENQKSRQKFEEAVQAKIPSLKIFLVDEFPRGIGDVVNLQREMKDAPIWLSKYQ